MGTITMESDGLLQILNWQLEVAQNYLAKARDAGDDEWVAEMEAKVRDIEADIHHVTNTAQPVVAQDASRL